MDVVRTDRIRRIAPRHIVAAGAALVTLAVLFGIAQLKPAAPPVARSTTVLDTVRRGPMMREVRGTGVLTPETVRWITATTDARVERVIVQAGTSVSADTVIVELSDARQQQGVRDAEWQLRAAEADFETARGQLMSERLDREAAIARLESEYEQARLRAEADAELEKQGLAARITRQISQTTADELARRLRLEQERLRVLVRSEQSQLAARRAQLEQRRAMLELQQERTDALSVRAGIDGILQQVMVQAGQSVSAGATIARVAQTDRLKATVAVPEMLAKDLAPGQPARVDTRNGVAAARVARVDPAVVNGTVTVDLAIDGPLPVGARPDLSVDAVIELDRIADAVYVTRPVNAQEGARGSIFRTAEGGTVAERVPVEWGRSSAITIEVRSGLSPGDEVIVSDTSAFDRHDRIRLR